MLSQVQFFDPSHTAAHQASLSSIMSQSLLRTMSIKLVMPSSYLLLCHPLLLLPSTFPRIMVFSSELALHIRWPKYESSSFSISPSNEYSGLVSFRIDQLDLLAVQVTRVFLAALKQYLLNHSKALSGLPFSRSSKIQCLYLANWLKILCEATSDSFPSHLF